MASQVLTHIIKDTPSSGGWKELVFITYANGAYYHMFTERTIDPKWIAQEVELGSIFKVKLQTSFPATHGIWLSEEGKLYIAPKDNPFKEGVLIEIENYYEKDIYSKSNIQRMLDTLWRNPFDQEAIDYLVKSPEWEQVLYFLRIQLSPLQDVELQSWVYKLLESYDKKYGEVFNKYCGELQMKITLFPPPSITILNMGNENLHFDMIPDENVVMDYYKRTSYTKEKTP